MFSSLNDSFPGLAYMINDILIAPRVFSSASCFQVGEFHAVRQKLTAELADQSNLVKALIVRAEDYRFMGDLCVSRTARPGLAGSLYISPAHIEEPQC